MKLFDVAKGLLKKIIPATSQVTHRKPTRTQQQRETQIKRPVPTPETRTRPAPAPTVEQPKRSIRHRQPEATANKLFDVAKGLLKKITPAIPQVTHRRQTRAQQQRETQIKRPAPTPETRTRPAPAPTAEKPKRRTKHRQPKPAPRPRTPSGLAEENILKGRSKPTPTELVENEEPAKGELNVIEWLREQASWADNTFTVALIMREIEGAIDREGFGEFCERITIDAINSDVDLAFYHSNAPDVYNGAMSLAALIGFNLNEDELFDAFVEDGLKNIDRVFGIKAFI